jgi:hypothetical protein
MLATPLNLRLGFASIACAAYAPLQLVAMDWA